MLETQNRIKSRQFSNSCCPLETPHPKGQCSLASICNYAVCVLSFLVSWASDSQNIRGPWCIAACAWPIIFAGLQYGFSLNSNQWTRFAIFTLLNSGNGVSQGLNDAWLSSNARSHQRRSFGLALTVIGSNLGGLAGQQLFQSSDAPQYSNAFVAILCLYGASIIMIGIRMGMYFWGNKRLTKQGSTSAPNTATGTHESAMSEISNGFLGHAC